VQWERRSSDRHAVVQPTNSHQNTSGLNPPILLISLKRIKSFAYLLPIIYREGHMNQRLVTCERLALANLLAVMLFSIIGCFMGFYGRFTWYSVPIFIGFNLSLYFLALVRYPRDTGFGMIFIFIILTQWLSVGMFLGLK